MNVQTQLAQLGGGLPQGSVHPTSTPIFQSATFVQDSATEFGDYDYSRSGNPTRAALESALGDLEKGERAFAFASGMAAVAASLGWLQRGDRLVAGADLYGGSVRFIERLLAPRGVQIRVVDTTDLNELGRALTEGWSGGKGRTLVYVESPTNPLLAVTDIAALAELTRAHDAALAVDNTMLSPYLQNPIELGADLVLHSATKHLGGHGDLTAGCVVTSSSSHGRKLGEHISFCQNAEGTALGPFDAWLLLRGMKTLGVRLDRECESAGCVAEALLGHPDVLRVHYPGLASHPGHELNRRQARGAGSLLSFETGDVELSRRLVEGVKLFSIAVSFGNVSSSISLPCYMSHASVPTESERRRPAADLVRLSVGLESPKELIEDLCGALQLASRSEESISSVG